MSSLDILKFVAEIVRDSPHSPTRSGDTCPDPTMIRFNSSEFSRRLRSDSGFPGESQDVDATVSVHYDIHAMLCEPSTLPVRGEVCVVPPLCRATSQGKYGSCAEDLVCVLVRLSERSER